jgi:hypothetical protein
MNESNLIPFNELTEEEQRAIASKGGKASVEARKRKKEMKEQIDLLLSLPLQDEETKQYLEYLGIDTDGMDNQMAMICSLWQQAIKGGKNAVQAATFLRDTVGEKPEDKVKADINRDITINID